MDKRQREIITSYFRAREIAVKQGQDAYKSYEINKFSLDNYIDIDNIDVNTRDMSNKLHELFYSDPVGIFNKMKFDQFNYVIGLETNLIPAIKNNPEIIKDLDLEKVTAWDVVRMIHKLPNLIEYFNFNKLNSEHIAALIHRTPDLVDRFDPNSMEGGDVATILMTHPELINKFKKSLNKLDDMDILHLLERQPKLEKYFKEYNREYNG